MIKIQGNLPKFLFIAVSGGVDSMAVLDFVRRKHDVCALFFDHGTPASKQALDFLLRYLPTINVPLYTGGVFTDKHKDQSWEEYWRDQRYTFFKIYSGFRKGEINTPVITAHHLDDCIETWVMTSLHGEGRIIPYQHANVIRPFRLTKKSDFIKWANDHEVPYVNDESNNDIHFTRNRVRHVLMPHILDVNPGIAKVIAKKVKKDFEDLTF